MTCLVYRRGIRLAGLRMSSGWLGFLFLRCGLRSVPPALVKGCPHDDAFVTDCPG